ncbi:PREDICTED: putative F-box protein At1g55070 [Camelina sativa]|uniref:F-box protein At1g55070 n=1 Tax=Camelina sativa TaxID=90675 RepID=A0ABM0X5T7_CAMSA|nr:PREDICTED: putative F-box protein At1g55070 [Camelina sativa]
MAMRKRKQQVTEENLTLTVSGSSGERCAIEYFAPIPVDLVIKILSRLLSGKSMAQCRCVCKLWSSIIRRQNYNQLFPINSTDPPRLLLTFLFGENLYSCSVPQKLDNNSTNNVVTATFLRHRVSPRTFFSLTCRPVRGLVCHQLEEKNHVMAVISNPITGEYITSPKVKTYGIDLEPKNYFGYDPIGNKFKVLCLTWSQRGTLEHQVLTLEDTGRKLMWRKIPCCISYSPLDDGVCINGVLYYNIVSLGKCMIVSFNVRSEKFDFINMIPQTQSIRFRDRTPTLCKLCAVDGSFVFWVLEDAEEEHKWTKHILVDPFKWNPKHVFAVGVTDRDEIVLSPKYALRRPLLHLLLQSREQH